MDTERWEVFVHFLETNSVTSDCVSQASEQLAGILQAVHAPEFALSENGSLEDVDIMRTINLLTGLPVKELYRQSLSELIGVTKGLKHRSAQAEVKTRINRGVSRIFRSCLDDCESGLHSILAYALGVSLGRLKPMRVFNPLTLSVAYPELAGDLSEVMERAGGGTYLIFGRREKDKLQRAFGRKPGNEIFRGIRTLLRFYVAFLLVDFPHGMNLTAAGLELCTHAFPVGLLMNKPYTWLILVA